MGTDKIVWPNRSGGLEQLTPTANKRSASLGLAAVLLLLPEAARANSTSGGVVDAVSAADGGTLLLLFLGLAALVALIVLLCAQISARRVLESVVAGFEERVATDAIERERAGVALEREAARAERLEGELKSAHAELDEFAYLASHDLKEPLRGIQNFATFILEDCGDRLDEAGRVKLETLRGLAVRMNALLDTLLHFSRVGRTELAIGRTSLQVLVEEVVDSLQPVIEAKGVEIRMSPAFPVVQCDRARIGEVLTALIANAVEYSDKNDPWVEIGYRSSGDETDPSKEPVVVYVRDCGIGISEKDHDAVFRIFKRLHSRSEFGGGHGAGLTIAKRIVERHGGKIWLESEAGVGTTVFFDLGERERV